MGASFPWRWSLSELEEPKDGAPTVFSTFACGGGSSMGYKRAGYRVVGNCEIDPDVAEVYKRNLHPEMSFVMDLREFNELESYPDELTSLDVLDGSPPCTSFSMIGNRERDWGRVRAFHEGRSVQRLDDLFFVYLDTVERLRPKVCVAENVTGLLAGNAKGYVSRIVERFRELGYDVQLFKLNAAEMDVPQARERVFFIANRIGAGRLRLEFGCRPVTFGEARGSEPGRPLTPTIAELFAERRRGEPDLRHACARLRGKRSFFNYFVHEDGKVCKTLMSTCTKNNIRACDGTFITDRDAANCSSFPQDYDFGGQEAGYLCGMSVPPSMMAHIAHEIRRQWLDA